MCGGGRLIGGMAIRAEQHASDTPVVRTCVGCKERAAKSSLLRLVAVEDVIRPDPRARLLAGVHICIPAWRAWDSRGGGGRSPGRCAHRDLSASSPSLSILAARNLRNSMTTAEQPGWAAGFR